MRVHHVDYKRHADRARVEYQGASLEDELADLCERLRTELSQMRHERDAAESRAEEAEADAWPWLIEQEP